MIAPRLSAALRWLISCVGPGWEHIGLTGDYVWAEEAQPTPGLLRPLRAKPSLLAA